MSAPDSWRERLYIVIFQTDTRDGRRFDSALLLVILASLLVVMIDSIDEIHQDYGDLLAYIEWGFTGIFLVEYLLRLYCSPKPLRYAFSFYGLVDLLAILPGFLALLYPDAQYLLIVRVIRMLRIFRVLKLRQYLSQANFLLTALRGSKQKIIVFFLTVMTLVTVFGALMYVVEGPEHGFTSIPRGIYWAIVTLTTVGFGDITPKTPLGQAIASLVMLTGYSIIAVPTGIFTAELATAMRQDPANLLQRDCPVCRKATHEVQAAFCCRCGNPLFPREKALWQRLGGNPPADAFDALLAAYGGADRHYHSDRHILACLEHFDRWRQLARRPDLVELALWTHDLVYDTQRQDNEAASAASTERWLDQAGLAALRPALRELIMATCHQAPPGDADAALVVDLDLAILAAPAPVYARYEADVRAEYAWVPEPLFRAGRGKLLRQLLEQPALYHCEPLRQRWEAAARANLRDALERLEQPA